MVEGMVKILKIKSNTPYSGKNYEALGSDRYTDIVETVGTDP